MSTALPGGSHLPVAGPRQALRAAARLVGVDWRAFAVMLFVNCLAAAAGLAGPWLLGRMIDAIENRSGGGAIDRLAAAALGIAVAVILLRRLGAYLGSRFGERVQARLREQFADWVLALPPAVVERTDTGDLAARGTGDITVIGGTLRDVAPTMLISALQAVFIVAAAIAVSPPLGICGLIGLAGIRIALRWYLRRARTAYLAAGSATSVLAGQLVASAAGARTIEALGLQERRRGVCAEAIADARRTQSRTLFLRTVFFPSIDISCVIPAVLVLIVGMVLVQHGVASLGSVVTAALYMQQLAQPIGSALEWIDQAQSSGASFARVEGVGLALPDRPASTSTRIPAGDRIEADAVCYAYDPDDGDVLSDVTLTIQPGERLALVGPSGAGKTTLARLLTGSDWPRTGTITVGGVPIAELAPEQLREQIQFVTQDQHLFRGTIRDNLRLGSPAASDADLYRALETVQADWARGLPDGLDTEIGAGRLRVSEAQLQQLALARVILADPHTLVLDEATAQLDPRSARRVEQSLAALLTGRTIIAVAHRLQTARDADRVAVMSDGRIIEIGSHEELLQHDGPYAALWQSWQGGPDHPNESRDTPPDATLGDGSRLPSCPGSQPSSRRGFLAMPASLHIRGVHYDLGQGGSPGWLAVSALTRCGESDRQPVSAPRGLLPCGLRLPQAGQDEAQRGGYGHRGGEGAHRRGSGCVLDEQPGDQRRKCRQRHGHHAHGVGHPAAHVFRRSAQHHGEQRRVRGRPEQEHHGDRNRHQW